QDRLVVEGVLEQLRLAGDVDDRDRQDPASREVGGVRRVDGHAVVVGLDQRVDDVVAGLVGIRPKIVVLESQDSHAHQSFVMSRTSVALMYLMQSSQKARGALSFMFDSPNMMQSAPAAPWYESLLRSVWLTPWAQWPPVWPRPR